ncbi:MAG TPA: hypothetical protein VG223_02705 [Solirubrobacteraceae bacterium]|nr:hypothetical protein [Solirubrobacteraceae bacterium]
MHAALTSESAEGLPELASVHWRPRVDARLLARRGRVWTAWSLAHPVPFTAIGVALVALRPVLAPISIALFVQAWIIPELYANRGAKVLQQRRRAGDDAERTALLLLGDLLDTSARELHADTGLAVQPGALGVWLVGEAGAVLVAPGGRRTFCYCVRVTGEALPSSDLIAHLLLALRADEAGFATVANLTFSGARWRVRRRMAADTRPALDAAVRIVRDR